MGALEIAEPSDKVRAFIAIRVDDAVESAIAEFVDSIRAPRDGIAWVRRENLHLTLKFLGPAVEMRRIEPLVESLRKLAAATAPFELNVGGVGTFPNLARPRVIWVGLDGSGLGELAAEIETAAERCGFAREQRAFSAHLTIGRVRDPRAALGIRGQLEAERERRFGSSRVEAITMYRSTLTTAGSIYEPLEVLPFH